MRRRRGGCFALTEWVSISLSKCVLTEAPLCWRRRVTVQAEMKEILQEQIESNDRLESHINEFHELLKMSSPA